MSIKSDPSGLGKEKRQAISEFVRKFRFLNISIRKFLKVLLADPIIQLNAENSSKIDIFRNWLREKVAQGILTPSAKFMDQPWLSEYLAVAYAAGNFDASKRTGIEKSFEPPVRTRTLELVFTRSSGYLKGLGDDLENKLATDLANGIISRKKPAAIAKDIVRHSASILKTRAVAIARTEMAHAFAEGQLDSYESLGISKLELKVEWVTSGNPCPKCSELAGIVLTPEQARGLIPRHTNCACAWSPVVEPEDGQKRSRFQIRSAVRESLRVEFPLSKRPASKSSWAGVDLL